MHIYPVEVEAHPTFQDGAFLEDQLYTYNVEQTGYDDGTYLTLWVKNQTGERLAGLHGYHRRERRQVQPALPCECSLQQRRLPGAVTVEQLLQALLPQRMPLPIRVLSDTVNIRDCA